MVSETTAAATGAVGVPRNDPMAMLPFCGYDMGDYFGHWLHVGAQLKDPPKIFHVNWFRTNDQGKFLWPGFGDNIRVIDWMIRRVAGEVDARTTPLGLIPHEDDLDVSGLELKNGQIYELLRVDWAAWAHENERSLTFLRKFGDRMPPAIFNEQSAFARRLRAV